LKAPSGVGWETRWRGGDEVVGEKKRKPKVNEELLHERDKAPEGESPMLHKIGDVPGLGTNQGVTDKTVGGLEGEGPGAER